MTPTPRVAISGTGLIGASIGLGLARRGWQVWGWDPDPVALEAAGARGALSESTRSFAGLLATVPDVLVLAGPPGVVLEQLDGLESSSLVMDVAGVKQPLLAVSGPARFVGTHPMAGREVTGPAGASPALFAGATWVVITDGAAASDLEAVERIIRLLGGRPIRMTAGEHDAAVAMVSHVPQILAAALANEAADRIRALDLAAGSFRDLTRVAASDPGTWVELLTLNRTEVIAAIEDFRERLSRVTGLLATGAGDDLAEFLERGREVRRRLGPTVVAVRVALADEPGELARVGRAFGSSGVDVRDLQLRHAPHGGGGLLTVSVRPGEAATLRTALEDEGLLVVD